MELQVCEERLGAGAMPSGRSRVRSEGAEPAASQRSLRPKEHGAYAILFVPLVVTLALTGISWTGGLVGIAAVAGFFANEPLLVAWGRRGGRAARELPHAAVYAIGWTVMAVAGGLLAVFFSDAATRSALLGLPILAAVAWGARLRLGTRSLLTQLLGIVALVYPVLPIVLGAGWEVSHAASYWGAWSVAQACPALAVRSIIALKKRRPDRRSIRVHDWGLAALTAVAVYAGLQMWLGWWQVLPMVVSGLVLRAVGPDPRHLKRIGWTLVAVNGLSGLLMLWTLG